MSLLPKLQSNKLLYKLLSKIKVYKSGFFFELYRVNMLLNEMVTWDSAIYKLYNGILSS